MVGVGLTAQAPHPAAARLFIDFLLSKEGQQLYQSAGRLVARSDLPQDESMKVTGRADRARRPCLGGKFRRRLEAVERDFFQLRIEVKTLYSRWSRQRGVQKSTVLLVSSEPENEKI